MTTRNPETNDGGRIKRIEETLEEIRSAVSETNGSTQKMSQEFQAFKQAIMGDETTGSRGIVWRMNYLEGKVSRMEKLVYGMAAIAGSIFTIVQILDYLK